MTTRFIVTTPLVGRQAETEILQQHVAQLMHGSGATVLLGGEAGIGKSRLIRELRQYVAQAAERSNVPTTILVGHCYETDQTLPLAPLLDLLRTMLARHDDDDVVALLGADAAQFALLLPELRDVLGTSSTRSVETPEQEKQRLFQALLRLFTRLARDARLLIVIEDLHWSDDTSLEFLLHLVRRLRDHPALLVLSYRSDEIQPALHRVLATLDREQTSSDLQLKRLTQGEVDTLLRAVFNQFQAIQPDFLHAVVNLTDGNPFFIEEVLRALITSGDIFQTAGRWDRKDLSQIQIPRSIQDAVARRTERISAEAREVLHLAAVAGRVFDFALLEALTRHDESHLLALIRELISVQLVEEETAERFAFRHALTRQAVYAQLLARERRSLHVAIGETLEQFYSATPELHLADLAYHFAAAEDWPRALDYAQRAGERAVRLFAPRAAAEQFDRAIRATEQLKTAPPSDLLRARARAHATLGDFEIARRDYEQALDVAKSSGDRQAEWQILLDLGELWGGQDYAVSGDYLDRALALARELGEPRIIAENLTQLGGWMLNRDLVNQAEQALDDALSIYTELEDEHGIGRTIDLLGTAGDIGGDIVRMDQRYQQAAALFRKLDDRWALSSVLATNCLRGGALGLMESVVTITGVPIEKALGEAEEAVQLARGIGWRAGEAYAIGDMACCLGAAGRYRAALMHGAAALAIAREIDHREWMTATNYIHGSAYLELMAFDHARPHLEEAATLGREAGSQHWLNLTIGALAHLTLDAGDVDRAAELLASVDPALPKSTLGQRRVWMVRAQLALVTGNPAAALDIVDDLYANAANCTEPADIPHLAWIRGRALRTLGRLDEAERALVAARKGAEARGSIGLLWRVHAALADLYQALGRDGLRDASLGAARSIIADIVADLPDDSLKYAFRDGAASYFPADALESPSNVSHPLTPREREVAILLARGLSNREIADHLFVGERTIETHVGNMLAKLEFRSRTQIAAWAIENGLTEQRGATT